MALKIGIYDPYLDTLGGGERYMMTIGQCLANRYQVDIFWHNRNIKGDLEKRLGLDLEGLDFKPVPTTLIEKWRAQHHYEALFYMSDGSIPVLFAKKNILCFMVPFTGKKGRSLWNQIKLKRINEVVAITSFTKRFVDQEYDVKSKIIFPPVATDNFRPGYKKNLILGVARFSRHPHAKKQEVLIEAFKEMAAKNWQLVLAGGLRPEERSYFDRLQKQASGLPVKLIANASFRQLQQLYGQAKIFWHAAGFDEDEEQHPERMEHFGIVVVEAMAAGCVPVVVGKGGIPEIVTPGKDGFLWQTENELIEYTNQLIKLPRKLKRISLSSIKSAQKFSETVFCKKINEII